MIPILATPLWADSTAAIVVYIRRMLRRVQSLCEDAFRLSLGTCV